MSYMPDGVEDIPEEVDGDGGGQREGWAVQAVAGVTVGIYNQMSQLSNIFFTWT